MDKSEVRGVTFLSDGNPASLERIAAELNLSLTELGEAFGLDERTLIEDPEHPVIQRVADIRRVLVVMAEMREDMANWLFHIARTPIRPLDGRTILQAIGAGDTEKVLRYLQTISSGQNG